MVGCRLEPDGVSRTATVSACERAAQWRWSLQLLELPVVGIGAASMGINAAISACGRSWQWEQALALLASAEDPDIVGTSAAISACGRAAHWQLAIAIFGGMQMAADGVALGAALSACAAGGCWEGALALLASFREDGAAPSEVALGAALAACLTAAAWRAALETVGALQRPGAMSAGFVAGACTRGGHAPHAAGALRALGAAAAGSSGCSLAGAAGLGETASAAGALAGVSQRPPRPVLWRLGRLIPGELAATRRGGRAAGQRGRTASPWLKEVCEPGPCSVRQWLDGGAASCPAGADSLQGRTVDAGRRASTGLAPRPMLGERRGGPDQKIP
ncbi:unnamed protein product [Prorocentrum cordatum]|uniref:Pentatricopeptide repeat-containing protein, chloroplastic n=1 Tax=Prorocentrum cordatum TaxID=2364126 RepID=A0ABN9QRJ9_9DINO|nr:unnamed protein product [Polarella glacialis]